MSQQQPLSEKLALITGCSGGIGQASARALARLGCSIAVHHSSESSKPIADKLVFEILSLSPGLRVHAFQADLSTYDGAEKLHENVVKTLGHPDILFANHGTTGRKIGPTGDIQDISVEHFEEIWRTHAGTSFRLTQLCLPYMESQKWGRIIYTSSVAATTGGVIGPHYASSKSALHGLAHWVSQRYSKDGITSNIISPALIADTVMMSDVNPELTKRIPVGRFGRSEEIASVVALVATNAYMTNHIIPVDGGMTSG
ncbi:3-oxoacyl-reductase [Cristinia sonorae]|uniref:3-oxoacyl-reductase n=1 Tax=Cristinia sonorae TaxID=1940300 RepID=A0A8K0UN91_9AGAR|nr:3-oxoacyl-reductase [Cristinia sonorae]